MADPIMTKRPNVLFIFTDQHRSQTLGWNGDVNLSTPGLDNLARNGTVFSRAVAGTPWCTPFRGALLTGQYPHVTGCDRTPSRLDPSFPTLADAFNAAGYHTAHVGKWHLSGSNSWEHRVPPEERGRFQYWMGYENNNKQNDVWVYGTDNEEPTRLEEYETRALSKVMMDHLKGHIESGREKEGEYQPFFAVLSVQPPHSVNRAWRAVVTRDGWRYACTPGNDWLLFNLKEDPFEMNNLCYNTIFQKDKERLHAELVRLLEETGDEFDMPEITLEEKNLIHRPETDRDGIGRFRKAMDNHLASHPVLHQESADPLR